MQVPPRARHPYLARFSQFGESQCVIEPAQEVLLAERKERRGRKSAEEKPKREKLSLYPLSIEDALRAAAKTGRPPKTEPQTRSTRGSNDAKQR